MDLASRGDMMGGGALLRSWFRYVQPNSSVLNRREKKKKKIGPQDKKIEKLMTKEK